MDKVKVSEDVKRLDDKIAANSFYSAQAQDTFYIDSNIFEKQKPTLEPTDLMIGDMVEHDGKVMKVIGITPSGESKGWKIGLEYKHNACIADISEIHPVELTDGILKQIAQWDDDNNRYLIGGLWEIRIVNNRIVHDTIFLPTLGSLQHLMRLYGVEINFNEK
jgi:hypothetical protein